MDNIQQTSDQQPPTQSMSPTERKIALAHYHSMVRSVKLQRLASIVGILAIGIFYLFLSPRLTLGLSWLPLVIEVVLVLPFIYSSVTRRILPFKLARALGFLVSGVATFALVVSIALLIYTLPQKDAKESLNLLRDAALLWLSNIIVFGLWFWEIDGGGPLKRHKMGHQAVDFLFPQQLDGNKQHWAPHLLDYLFVAFTNATAFSPTDTPPLTRQAKMLMMIEAIISLLIVALLAARAVNILS